MKTVVDKENTNLLHFFGGEYQYGGKKYVSVLGGAHIHIIKALEIIAKTGGSISCDPSANRIWKVKNFHCCCESSDLSRSCKHFVQDYDNREYIDL